MLVPRRVVTPFQIALASKKPDLPKFFLGLWDAVSHGQQSHFGARMGIHG